MARSWGCGRPNRGAGCAEIGCRKLARRALQTGRSAHQILIVDEVLAVGGAEFHKKCLGKMKDVAGHADSQRLTTIVPIA